MKPLNLAFVYNLKSQKTEPSSPLTFLEADADEIETIGLMKKTLVKLAGKVISIPSNEHTFSVLQKKREQIDLVFNYSVGINGDDKYSNIPTICEILGIPYTGSGPLTQALVSNKVRAKKSMLAHGIPTLKYGVFTKIEEIDIDGLVFPVIVKPTGYGSSAGMTKKCVVETPKELKKIASFMLNTFNGPVMIEHFLTGREFSIPMLGNPPKILPIVELRHHVLPKRFPNFASFEVKNFLPDKYVSEYVSCPANIKPELLNKINDICYSLWDIFEIRDWCRVDVRCNSKGDPYVLEINSPAALEPPQTQISYCSFPLAAREAGLDYAGLLNEIIESAVQRGK